MKKPAALLAACTLVSSLGSPVRAEMSGMEEALFSNIPTVVTASLKRQALDQVPGSMTVITDREIRARGYLNLIDALTTVPGFKMYQEGFEGLISPVIRGYQWISANVKLMIDGHALNDPFYKGWENWQEMPLDDVKQIEVIRGPGSSLYGSDAFSAVVNIITKDAAGGQVTATGGTLGAWGGSATVAGARDRDLRYKASFSQQGEQGGRLHYQKDFISDYLSGFVPSQSLAPKTNRKMFKRHDASAVVEYKGFSVTARHVETVRQWSEGYVGIMTEDRSWMPKQTSYVEASYKTSLPDESELTVTASFDSDVGHYRGQFLPRGFYWDPFDSNSAFPDGAFYHTSYRGDQQHGRGVWRKEAGGHDLTAGAEYSKVYFPWTRTLQNYDPITLYPYPGGFERFSGQDPNNWFAAEDTSESHWGAFGQDMFRVEPFSFILGCRYDHYSDAGTAFSPRLALIWTAPQDMIVKASFGQAFMSPYAGMKYIQIFGYVSKKDLRPETVQTWELSLQSSYLKPLRHSLTGFYSRIMDGFSFAQSRAPVYDNTVNTHFVGFELEERWDVTSAFQVYADFSYARPTRNSLDEPDHSERIGNAGVTWYPVQRLSLHARGNFVSSYDRSEGRPGKIAGYGLLNLCAVYAVTDRVDVSLIGNNVLDKTVHSYNPQGRIDGVDPTDTSGYGNDFPWKGSQFIAKVSYRW